MQWAEEGSRTGTTMRSGCTCDAAHRIDALPDLDLDRFEHPVDGTGDPAAFDVSKRDSRARVCAASRSRAVASRWGSNPDVHAPGRLWSGLDESLADQVDLRRVARSAKAACIRSSSSEMIWMSSSQSAT